MKKVLVFLLFALPIFAEAQTKIQPPIPKTALERHGQAVGDTFYIDPSQVNLAAGLVFVIPEDFNDTPAPGMCQAVFTSPTVCALTLTDEVLLRLKNQSEALEALTRQTLHMVFREMIFAGTFKPNSNTVKLTQWNTPKGK